MSKNQSLMSGEESLLSFPFSESITGDSSTSVCKSEWASFSKDESDSNDESEIISSEECIFCYEHVDMDKPGWASLEHKSGTQHPNQLYHLSCILPWILEKKSCPMCFEAMGRDNILTNQVEVRKYVKPRGISEPLESSVDMDLEAGSKRKRRRRYYAIGIIFVCLFVISTLLIYFTAT